MLGGVDKIVEGLLKRYLDERGWRYEWQTAIGAKVPEATILNEAGQPIAVMEATWLPQVEQGSKKPKQVGFLERAKQELRDDEILYSEWGGVDRIYILRERLEAKRRQAQAALGSNLPFLLALSNDVPLWGSGYDIYSLLQDFPEFSAVATLHEQSAISAARQFLNRGRLPKGVRQTLTLVRRLLQERYGYRLGHKQKNLEAYLAEESLVADVDFTVMRLEIVLNPVAELSWVRDLIGVFDRVYEWRDSSGQFEMAYEGYAALLNLLAARILAGSISVPWQEAVSTSRSGNFYEERDPATHSA